MLRITDYMPRNSVTDDFANNLLLPGSFDFRKPGSFDFRNLFQVLIDSKYLFVLEQSLPDRFLILTVLNSNILSLHLNKL